VVASVLFAACSGLNPSTGPDRSLTVFAASSLQPPFQRIGSPSVVTSITFNFAGTQTLTSQLIAGAEADVFAAADTEHMKQLESAGLLEGQSRVFAHNSLEIAVAPGNPKGIRDLRDLARPGLVVVLADPSVPAGKYGKAALEKLGVWPAVADRIAPAENVRAALLLVSRGECPLGIVYRTDAAADPGVKVIATFPPDTHPPIIYPAALTADSKNPSAARLLEFLTSPAVRPIFEKRGFTVLQ